MNSTQIVVANPVPDPARRRPVRAHGMHDAARKGHHRPIHPTLDAVLAAYCGGNFVGGRMGTSFGS